MTLTLRTDWLAACVLLLFATQVSLQFACLGLLPFAARVLASQKSWVGVAVLFFRATSTDGGSLNPDGDGGILPIC